MTRNPAVQNRFYPGDPDELRQMVQSFLDEAEAEPESAAGILCPHAGYVFSGGVAGKTFGRVEVPDTVVVLNPSHNYARPKMALWTGGDWLTPLGKLALHEELTDALGEIEGVTPEDRVHLPEHSGEVVMPFIQICNPEARIAVVCIAQGAGLEDLRRFGTALPEAFESVGAGDTLVVASSDMSHEDGPDALERVNSQDGLVHEQLENFSPEGVYRACREHSVTMCGRFAVVAMMFCAREQGATEATMAARATSADSRYGGGNRVVGYTGMIFR
jgi:hypothetical protein